MLAECQIEMSIAGQSRVLIDTQLPMCLLHMIQNILSPHAMEQSPVTLMKTLKIISFLTTVKSVIHLPLNEAEMKIVYVCPYLRTSQNHKNLYSFGDKN